MTVCSAPDCHRPIRVKNRGLCHKHYLRWWKAQPSGACRRVDNIRERLLGNVRTSSTGCWDFQGTRILSGYGRISWNGRAWLTHRVSYTLFVGTIPAGLEIDHLCKNKACCNPAHLEAVTRGENIRRGTQWHHLAEKERAKTVCPAGHSYDSENTYFSPSGCRQCRICKRAAGHRYAERSRAAIAAGQSQVRFIDNCVDIIDAPMDVSA